MSDPIRTVLVDDHPVYRDGLTVLLASLDGVEVIGTAGDGVEAIDVVNRLNPDVVVMDIQMPVMDGVEATRRIVAEHPQIGVVVLTMSEDDETVFDALRAGARGYLLKGARQNDISRAIRAVAGGDAIFGPRIASRIGEYFTASTGRPAPVPFPQLTERERQILELVASGRSNQQIAGTLYLSPKTVRNNLSNIFGKLHVAGRTEAVIAARDAGLGGASSRTANPGTAS